MNDYPKGTRARLSVAITVAGVLTDPTDVTLCYKDPAAVTTVKTYSGAQIIKDSTGNYHYDLDLPTAGLWTYRFESSGTVVGTSPDSTFRVQASEF
jgi:uncharacterized protein RhaS with RHS repeats